MMMIDDDEDDDDDDDDDDEIQMTMFTPTGLHSHVWYSLLSVFLILAGNALGVQVIFIINFMYFWSRLIEKVW